MNYTVIVNDRSYDLPGKTLAVTEQLEAVIRVDRAAGASLREKFQKTMGCLVDLMGREAVEDALGSADIDKVDVNEITLTFRKIVDAYNKPLDEYNTAQGLGALAQLPIDKILALADAAKQVSQMEAAAAKKK